MTSLAEYRALFDLTATRAVVIGAGSGIGDASARALAAHGAAVVCADLAVDAAQSTADAITAAPRYSWGVGAGQPAGCRPRGSGDGQEG